MITLQLLLQLHKNAQILKFLKGKNRKSQKKSKNQNAATVKNRSASNSTAYVFRKGNYAQVNASARTVTIMSNF